MKYWNFKGVYMTITRWCPICDICKPKEDFRRSALGNYSRNCNVCIKKKSIETKQKKELEKVKQNVRATKMIESPKDDPKVIQLVKDNMKVELDFADHPELLDKVREMAKKDIRTINEEILWIINVVNYVQNPIVPGKPTKQ